MRSHLLRITDGKAHRAVDTECPEFNSRFLVYVYVDNRGDPVSVKLLDVWREDQPCQKTNANAGTASESTRHQEPDASARSEQTMEEPSVRALDSAHPIGVKIADTTSGAISVSPHVPASSGSAKECSGTAAPALDSAPPSEPEAVTALRHDARTGRSMVPNDRIRTVVDYIDTLSARLKRAEGLLHGAVPFLADNGHMEQQIENFLAEKGDA